MPGTKPIPPVDEATQVLDTCQAYHHYLTSIGAPTDEINQAWNRYQAAWQQFVDRASIDDLPF